MESLTQLPIPATILASSHHTTIPPIPANLAKVTKTAGPSLELSIAGNARQVGATREGALLGYCIRPSNHLSTGTQDHM